MKPLHAVYCTQQGRQREPSVKTLCSPLSTKFRRHCWLASNWPNELQICRNWIDTRPLPLQSLTLCVLSPSYLNHNKEMVIIERELNLKPSL